MNQIPPPSPTTSPKIPPHWPWLAISAIALGVWLSWLGYMSWQFRSVSSPDEAANRLMAQQYAETGTFRVPTKLTADQLQAFHPRSLATKNGELLPGSFLGFIFVHGLALRFGTGAPIVLTLVLFTLALVAWYRVGRRYWSWPWALSAVWLLATTPAIAVYQALPWFHAATFTSLIILAGFALLRFQERQTWSRAVVVGLAYGAALFIRPIELLFTGPAVAVVMLVHTGKRRMFLATVLTTLVAQVPWLLLGRSLFGAVLASGYTTTGITVSGGAESGLPLLNLFMPPGGWSWHFLRAAWESLVMMFPLMSLLSVVAIVAYCRRKFSSPVKILKIGAIILFGLYYLAYYGSLDLWPNTPDRVGVFSSYVRYWPILFVALSAGVVIGLRLLTKKNFKLAVPIVLAIVALNIYTTGWNAFGGLAPFRTAAARYQTIRDHVVAETESDSLVIAGQLDKVLVGSRLTSYGVPDTGVEWRTLAEIQTQRPVYFLSAGMTDPLSDLNRGAAPVGLVLREVGTVDGRPFWRLEQSGGGV